MAPLAPTTKTLMLSSLCCCLHSSSTIRSSRASRSGSSRMSISTIRPSLIVKAWTEKGSPLGVVVTRPAVPFTSAGARGLGRLGADDLRVDRLPSEGRLDRGDVDLLHGHHR